VSPIIKAFDIYYQTTALPLSNGLNPIYPTALTEATDLTEVVQRLAQGDDRGAWEDLVTLTDKRIRGLCKRLTGSESTADDTLQETLLQIKRSAHSFRPDDCPSSRSADCWVLRIAANTAISMLLRDSRRYRREISQGWNQSAPRYPLAAVEDAEIAAAIHQAVADLPIGQREPVTLHFMAGMSLDDVARELKLPVGTLAGWSMRLLRRESTYLWRPRRVRSNDRLVHGFINDDVRARRPRPPLYSYG
jgi:RNA polymerase sigma factor (sigma-70 family)